MRARRRFRTILADPPWAFTDTGSRMTPSYAGRGRERAHYPVTTLDKLVRFDSVFVRRLAARPSILALWAPNALVLDGQAQQVARAWGFVPKQIVPWIKTDSAGRARLGGGHYTRVVHESLIICARGDGAASLLVRDKSVAGLITEDLGPHSGLDDLLTEPIVAPRGEHSAKPDESYELLERLFAGPRLELYARRRYSAKWTAWGNEVSA